MGLTPFPEAFAQGTPQSYTLPHPAAIYKPQSCLMQDEPAAATSFSYKMSLEEERDRMLGKDRQHERRRTIELGENPSVSRRHHRDEL